MSNGDELRARVRKAANDLPSPSAEALGALQEKLDAMRTPVTVAEWPQALQDARTKMDTRHAEPATSHRGVAGLPLVAAKRTFRTLFQPFINELLRKQVEFNESLLHAVMTIYEAQREQTRSQAELNKQLLQRIAQLEKKQ